MKKTLILLTVLVAVAVPGAWAQKPATATASGNVKETVTDYYTKVLAQLRGLKTKEDVAKMIDATETKDWVAVDPMGRKSTLADAQKALEASLKSEKRVLPDLQVLWMNEAGGKATVVLWVTARASMTDNQGALGPKGKAHETAIGSLCRDTLVLTPKGWRRSMHEKFFPDQPLSIDGVSRVPVPGVKMQGAPAAK